MIILYSVTVLLLITSAIFNINKTKHALAIAAKKLLNILPAFLLMLIFVSLILTLLPEEVILNLLDNPNPAVSVLLASLIGSITLMPGFVVFPLCGILLKKGVTYMVLSAFTTTLMMVGILTYPIEKEYFGARVTITRNILSFLIAIAAAIVTGIFFGEVF
ncbi:MAG: permease [Spirochaetia bacterium]|jgi:uncharacterized membrane protein YraQ (UPF0718 family)|nr:permease [Spirochaetia bacterium]